MKQLIKAAFLLLTILLNVTAWGQTTIEFVAGNPSVPAGSNTSVTGSDEMTMGGITVKTTCGAFNAPQYRFAKNATTTITSTVGNITKIVFECTNDNPASGFDTGQGVEVEGNNGTWTGNASEITLTSNVKQVRATKITFTVGGVTPPPPGEGYSLCEVAELPDNTAVVAKNDAIVLGQSGKYLYLKDTDCGYIRAYGESGQTYHPADVVPAGYGGTKVTWDMEAELNPINGFQPAKNNLGGREALESAADNITISQVGHETWGHYVRIDNVAFNTVDKTFSDTTGTTGYYDRFSIQWPEDLNKTYTVYAIVGSYKTNYQLLPTSIGGTEEQYKFEVDGLWFLIKNDNDVYVTSSQTDEYCGNIIIPSSVTYQGITYQVAGIDAYAFQNCINLNGLSIPVSISYVSSSAFLGSRNIDWIYIYGVGPWTAGNLNVLFSTLYIGKDVTSTPGLQINPFSIYSFAPIPPSCDRDTFTDYSGTLHVPAASLAAYFTAPYWSNFGYIDGDAIEPVSISINTDTMELQLGEQLNLSAIVSPSNATPNNITWKSSNPSVGIVNNGIITAVGLGECDIILQCLDKKAICHIVVIAETIVITLDQQEAMVLPNHIIELKPSATPTMPDLIVTSSDPTVAAARIVNGKVQVVGIKEGTATITVGSVDGSAVPASCLLTVYTEMGDVNMDGFVNVSDVTTLISYILGQDVNVFKLGNADLNDDGFYNVADVTTLIAFILAAE